VRRRMKKEILNHKEEMNLREEILKEHSRKQTLRLANWVGKDRTRFTMLMDIFLHDEYRVVQRASWIIMYTAADHPEWIKPWIKKMLEYSGKPVHDAVKRNILRILQDVEIPKPFQGMAATVCFNFLLSQNEPVAVKVFSMSVLANLAKYEPELKQEIILIIEEQIEWGKPAFRSRGKKILRQLREP